MAAREYKFNFVMTDDEKHWLQVLADAESRTAGGWLRAVIKREYDALQARYEAVNRELNKSEERRSAPKVPSRSPRRSK